MSVYKDLCWCVQMKKKEKEGKNRGKKNIKKVIAFPLFLFLLQQHLKQQRTHPGCET